MFKKLINILLRRFELTNETSKEIIYIKYPFSTLIIDETFHYEDEIIKEFKDYALKDFEIRLDEIYLIHCSYVSMNLDSSNHSLNSETHIKITEKNGKYTGLIFLYSDLN